MKWNGMEWNGMEWIRDLLRSITPAKTLSLKTT
jgi:hypothetical protein